MNIIQNIIDLVNKENPKFDGKSLYIFEAKVLVNEKHNHDYNIKRNMLSIKNEKILYHGTPLKNIDNIISKNFVITEAYRGMDGHIGRGIYFSDMAEQSIYYCLKEKYIGNETDFIILVCKVELGRCYEMKRTEETNNCSKQDNYDSHSTNYNFGHEYCLFDSDQIVPVCKLHLKVLNTS